MTTLGQIVGITKGTRTSAQRDFDAIYKTFQKPQLFNGFTKTHTPFEGTMQQPAQDQLVQENATTLLQRMEQVLTRAFDVEATKDYTDTKAKANVILSDGTVLLTGVPVSHLLWLEKQFSNFVTVFRALPIQSAAETWDAAANLDLGVLRTPAQDTPTTKKDVDFRVVWAPQEGQSQPPEIREVTRDVQSGIWTTVKFTSAISPQDKELLVSRATDLLNATKQAIVQANHQEAQDVSEGSRIFSFLFDGIVAGR